MTTTTPDQPADDRDLETAVEGVTEAMLAQAATACPPHLHEHPDGSWHYPGTFTTRAFEAPAELQLAELVVPLKAAAERRVDEDVVVWIPGGMTIDGRLVSVNDDDTITVRDAKREYDIALASIAVLEGSK